MQVKLEINEIDLTSRLITDHPIGRAWSLTLNEGAEVDLAAFSLDDPNRTLSLTSWHEVIVTRTDVTPNKKLFGGFLTQMESVDSGVGRVFLCQAQDYTILLHRYIVDRDYESQTDAAILSDAFTQSGLAFINATTKVQAIKTFDNMRFAGHSLYQILDVLAEASGALWYVNPEKQLVYQAPETDEAGFSLSDSPDDATSFGYWGVQHTRDASSLFNRVLVRGGKELSDDQDIILPGDGSQTIFRAEKDDGHIVNSPPTDADTTFTPQGVKRVEVFINTGTDGSPIWTQKGVGLEGEDELGTAFGGKTVDVLWNPATGRLQFQTAPPNFATNSLRVRGRYPIQIEVEEINQDSIDATGQTITKVIVDESIVTTDMAIEVATAFLNEHSEEQEQITVSFDHDGLELGQQILFSNTVRGVSKKLKAKSINIAFVGGVTAQYTAALSSSLPARTLTLILREIHEATRRKSPTEEARTDVRRPKREVIEIVDVGAFGRSLGPIYYVEAADGTPLIDLDAFGISTDGIALNHHFDFDGDDAFWPYAILFDRARDHFLEFDGIDDRVTVSDTGATEGIEDIFSGGGAVEAWVYARGTGGGGFGRIMNKFSPGGWRLFITSGRELGFDHIFSTRNGVWRTSTKFPLNVWAHVAVVYDNSDVSNSPTIYFNGISQSISPITTPEGSAASDAGIDLAFGATSGGGTAWNGFMDDFRIWNTSRTAVQIQANMGSELSGAETGLAGLWKASEGSGAAVGDSTSNNNDGTITGALWRNYRRGPSTQFVAGFSKSS